MVFHISAAKSVASITVGLEKCITWMILFDVPVQVALSNSWSSVSLCLIRATWIYPLWQQCTCLTDEGMLDITAHFIEQLTVNANFFKFCKVGSLVPPVTPPILYPLKYQESKSSVGAKISQLQNFFNSGLWVVMSAKIRMPSMSTELLAP
ncbi:hypothetical protein E6O75_ATG03860 [Venturia nashicola]|uniref:Uncharacterized protein n=1 Tax=Venturia nashicola TaxID=86259 RepID=A0A4Z1P9Q6_9PEZI|nr:hypothetical protein E6O75_ATG03860 [Venturia nashicola]